MIGIKKIMHLGIGFVTAMASASALSQELPPPPRGDDIDSLASNCNIGPFQQTGKAGRYNELCTTLTDGEKCLALIKENMTALGQLTPTNDVARVTYCLEHFKQELLGE